MPDPEIMSLAAQTASGGAAGLAGGGATALWSGLSRNQSLACLIGGTVLGACIAPWATEYWTLTPRATAAIAAVLGLGVTGFMLGFRKLGDLFGRDPARYLPFPTPPKPPETGEGKP